MEECSSIHKEEGKRKVTLHQGCNKDVVQYIITKATSIKRIERGKIQLLILACSRERAFFLFSRICKKIQNVALTCHAAVGSLKFERDLKALNYGIDVLIVTPGRIRRLYDRNENCFDRVSTILVDEAESLFTRGMISRTKECCELFSSSELHVFYNSDCEGEKLCTIDDVKNLLSTRFQYTITESSIEFQQEDSETESVLTVPPSSYVLLPESDSISIPKRIPYILNDINTLLSDACVSQIIIHSFSEYNINYLLSFLIEHKEAITVPNVHLICFSETNIHKEIRSRLQFILQTAKDPSIRVICIIHDCLLPILLSVCSFDGQLHMDVPLSKNVFHDRLMVLRSNRCQFYLTSTQLKVVRLLFNENHSSLTRMQVKSLDKEKKLVDGYMNRKKENQETTVCQESIEIEGLTEKEAHSLFYQNEEAEIVEKKDTTDYVELKLDEIDAEGLENLDEELEMLEQQHTESQYSHLEHSIPMIPQLPLQSIFNPFYNPGVIHCYSNQYSLFSFVFFTIVFIALSICFV